MPAVKSRLRRRDQAKQTRDRVVAAAYRRFCSDGYEATTMQQIADDARVAVQTVYFTFRTKARLLADVEEQAVLGDAPAEHWREKPWAIAMLNETDPRRVLERFVWADTEIKSRLSPLIAAIRGAVPTDPDAAAGRDRGRDEFFGSVVHRIAALGGLRDGMTPARALDIIRVTDTLEAFGDLTTRRGWSVADWRDWLVDLLSSQLLRTPIATAERRRGTLKASNRRARATSGGSPRSKS